ncbi:MAG TPA: EAL domain-containing protein, partial [Bacillales bacterium]|nr:EAL domain-containing protein [Bacillales bacterium]
FLIYVNVSPRQLLQYDFVDTVKKVLADYDVDAGSLVFEITENIAVYNNPAIMEKLGELKALNVKLAVDDFGTGYSSLSYLTRLPIDVLKIDKSFIENIRTAQDSSAIINGISVMARQLGLKVVAEGIETQKQLSFLKGRCNYGQGFLFSRPLPARQIEEKYFLGYQEG